LHHYETKRAETDGVTKTQSSDYNQQSYGDVDARPTRKRKLTSDSDLGEVCYMHFRETILRSHIICFGEAKVEIHIYFRLLENT